jgi:hypothetical protein
MNKPTEKKKQHIKDQISKCLMDPVLPRHEDPCVWWKDNAWQYHYLQPLAQHYLLTPAIQVATGRLSLLQETL